MSHTTFLGIPVEGQIVRTANRKAQRPREEFEALVAPVVNDPYITAFGWRQATPYFNDGEPCVFGAYGLWVRTADDLAPANNDEDDDEDGDNRYLIGYSTHPSLGGQEGWGDSAHYSGTREVEWRRCQALSKAIEGGQFDDVLLDLFGDHAAITVRRTGIEIEFYEHD